MKGKYSEFAITDLIECKHGCGAKFTKNKICGHHTHCKLNPIKPNYNRVGRLHSEETKQKIREARVKYLKERNGSSAWERRSEGLFSNLEQWFYDECILKYKLNENHLIINEYCETPYFIDFAFINEKIAAELDGQVHFVFGEKRFDHDTKKDNFLKCKGWRLFRIPYFERNQKSINDFLAFLGDPDIHQNNEMGYLKYLEYKNIKRHKIANLKNESKLKLIEHQIVLMINSDIEFNKLGWVNKVSLLIGVRHQKIKSWMIKNMNDFYFKNCKIRK
jgi:very-short-patch-repair endonuclease